MSPTPGFKIRVAVFLVHNDHLLLVRQNQRPFWVLPGGTLETGETLEACGIREIQEEVNLEISIKHLLALSDFFLPNKPQAIDLFFLGQYKQGTLLKTKDENLDDAQWVPVNELNHYQIEPAHVVNRLISTLQQSGVQGLSELQLGYVGSAMITQ